MTIKLHPLKRDQLPEFKIILGSSDFGGCFCAVWTACGPDWEGRCSDKSAPNFFTTAHGHRVGYLVYDDLTLIGWTGSGPKTSFPLLETKLGSRLSPFVGQRWSIGCFAVKSEFRGQGLPDKIIATVVDLAQKSNATRIEAYPVRPFDEPRSYRGTEGLCI